MTMIKKLGALSLLAAAVLASTASAQTLDMYIMTGQSNSLGTTKYEEPFDTGSHEADGKTYFYYRNVDTTSGNVYPAVIGESGGLLNSLEVQDISNVKYWGPEYGFVRQLYDAREEGDNSLYFVKASRGGGGNSYWVGEDDPGTGDNQMYRYFLETIGDALTEATGQGFTVNVKGMIYVQGESNNTTDANNASQRLSTLAAQAQHYINQQIPGAADNMQLLIGQTAVPYSTTNRTVTMEQQVKLASLAENAYYIGTSDLPLKSDNLHFGKDAKLEIGQRLANVSMTQEQLGSAPEACVYFDMESPAAPLSASISELVAIADAGVNTLEGLSGQGWKTDGAVIVANEDSPLFGTETFSINFWFNKSTDASYYFLTNKGASSFSGSPGWAIWVESDSKLGIQLNDSIGASQKYYSADNTVETGSWHMATMVVDRGANMVTAYLDGVRFAAAAITDRDFTSPEDWTMTYQPSGYDEYAVMGHAMSANDVLNQYHGSRFFKEEASTRYRFSDHFDQYTASSTGLYAFDEFNPRWTVTAADGQVDSGDESAIYSSNRSQDALGANSNAWISRTPGTILTSKGFKASSNKEHSLKLMALSGTNNQGAANEIGLTVQVLAGIDQGSAAIIMEETVKVLPGLTQDSDEAWFSLPFTTDTLNDTDRLFVRIRYDSGSQWLHLDHVMLAEQVE